MTTLLINIKQLLQTRDLSVTKVSGTEMNILPKIDNAFLKITNDVISDFGQMADCPNDKTANIIDCSGRIVLPCWCDSHTHLVYAENRDQEFVDRINGLSYEDIAGKGGGILNSAKKLNETSEDNLYQSAAQRLQNLIALGTGAIEIKSGYGLSVEGELKMLRVIRRLKQNFDIPIKATFLGAHAIPSEFKNNRDEYVKLIIDNMLPIISKNQLADFIDVFCETNYFTAEESEQIIVAGANYGLQAKIHVNQFTAIGGIAMAIKNKALSVDHLEILTDEDILALKKSETMPVSLPTCSFFISIPYTPARKLINAGLPLAIASDYNPGTSPSGNMNFVLAIACIKLKITPEEAINAATINGAYAMGISEKAGSICIGKKANFILTKPLNHYNELAYLFGENLIENVFINGKKV